METSPPTIRRLESTRRRITVQKSICTSTIGNQPPDLSGYRKSSGIRTGTTVWKHGETWGQTGRLPSGEWREKEPGSHGRIQIRAACRKRDKGRQSGRPGQ